MTRAEAVQLADRIAALELLAYRRLPSIGDDGETWKSACLTAEADVQHYRTALRAARGEIGRLTLQIAETLRLVQALVAGDAAAAWERARLVRGEP